MNQYMTVLCSCAMFKEKEKHEIKDILSRTQYKIMHYQKNDFIFRADQPPTHIGIVLNGGIEIQNNLESGKFFNVFYKKKGDAFGGPLILSDMPICKFDIIAKTQCDIFLIHKQSVLEVLLKDDIIARNILNLFAKSVLLLNVKLELFSYSSIQKKIAFALLYNIKPGGSNSIRLTYSKKAWAEHLNVSRSSLSRELKKLEDAGIIGINHKTISILKRDDLKAILNDA